MEIGWQPFDEDIHQEGKTSEAVIELDEAEARPGEWMPCIFATCEESGVKVGPVWGHKGKSVRRALAMLTEACTCGATFHEGDEEGDPD